MFVTSPTRPSSILAPGSVQQAEWPSDRAAIEIGDVVLTNKKIREVLKWAPQTTLVEGLRRTAKYFGPRLEKYL